MTADLELLPLPEEEWNVRYGYCADTVTDYARANVAHATAAKDAEIEALRAEVKDQRRAYAAEFMRAERMAEALREARNIAMEWTVRGRVPECGKFGEIAQDLDALLRDQEEGT